MSDIFEGIWNLLFTFLIFPLLLGLFVSAAFAFIYLVGNKLDKSKTLRALTEDHWWGFAFVFWIVGVVTFGVFFITSG